MIGLSGCASKETATTASSTGSGVVVTDDNGVSVEVPVGYTRIKDSAMLQSMTADASVNPADQKLKARLVEYAPSVEHTRVFAFKRGADFNDYFNVQVVTPGGLGAENVDDLYPKLKRSLEEKLGSTNVGFRDITVSGTKAIRVEYQGHSGEIPLRGTQVWVFHNDVALGLTINQNDAATHAAEADRIIDSLRLR